MTVSFDLDRKLRSAAFVEVRRRLEIRDPLTAEDLGQGFVFQGHRIPLINPRRGIFKPKEMKYALSIKTVIPKKGGRVWYDDQREAHNQVYRGEETIEYSFMGDNPDAAENRWLRDAMQDRVPLIYFLGAYPGHYHAIIPATILGWDSLALRAQVAVGLPGELQPDPQETALERRYALRQVKARLHQTMFRAAVIAAYRGRCALSGLPETRLLDAAHIVADGDELFGQPVITNGLPLSKLHHAAFDAHLIGVNPDYRIVVSKQLLGMHDGPTLHALKTLDGRQLISRGVIVTSPTVIGSLCGLRPFNGPISNRPVASQTVRARIYSRGQISYATLRSPTRTSRKPSSPACRFSMISSARASGSGRLSRSVRLLSLSQNTSRLVLSRAVSSA